MNNQKITSLSDPTVNSDAATRGWVISYSSTLPGDNLGNHVAILLHYRQNLQGLLNDIQPGAVR